MTGTPGNDTPLRKTHPLRTKSYPLFRWYLGEADGIGAAGVPVPSAGAAEFAGPGF
jgi:hypothetical protein